MSTEVKTFEQMKREVEFLVKLTNAFITASGGVSGNWQVWDEQWQDPSSSRKLDLCVLRVIDNTGYHGWDLEIEQGGTFRLLELFWPKDYVEHDVPPDDLDWQCVGYRTFENDFLGASVALCESILKKVGEGTTTLM